MTQPFLHDGSVALAAPVQAWGDHHGESSGQGVRGVFVGDERIASRLTHTVVGRTLEHTATTEPGGGRTTYHWVVRAPELGVDPAAVLRVERTACVDGLAEDLVLVTSATHAVDLTLQVRLQPDASAMEGVKQGGPDQPLQAGGLTWSWRDETTSVTLDPGTAQVTVEGSAFVLTWQVSLPARGDVRVGWRLTAHDSGAPFVGSTGPRLQAPAAADPRLQQVVSASWADLNALLLAERVHPEEAFLAAGAPWFLTLFGRDSLLAARLLVRHHPQLARTTLVTLARRQGVADNPYTEEQPGKILHEVRRTGIGADDASADLRLPPEYYGTIDATCLWVMLLGDLADAGEDVSDLYPALDRALGWMERQVAADDRGFLAYVDHLGTGLTNQGWKDSGDSVSFADGRQAEAPIALVEVQGYAHAAALVGARLLTARGDEAGAARWRSWAADLAARFRTAFWVEDADGRYPALALDGQGVAVDGCASNMGHLLGTGILSAEETALVVARLVTPEMFSGYGIRTMSTRNAAYWPLSYHVGSVWSHDTAIAVDGMLREGYTAEARLIARGLLRAAEGFGGRLPELFGGQPAPASGTEDGVWPPHPYPASCRPQAWAAASVAVLLRALG